MMLDKRISEIMRANVVTAEPNATIHDIACIMAEKSIGSVIIGDGDMVSGIITERDITHRLQKGNDLSKAKARGVMTKDIVSVTPDTTVGEAIDILFKNRFRRLPVIKNRKLLGIVTSTDICHEINNPHAFTTVGDIMRRDVTTTSGGRTIREALSLMMKAKSSTGRIGVGSVVVTTDEGLVQGILTERDIIKYIVARDRDVKKTLVREIMSTDMITVKQDVVICHAADLLSYYGFRHLPIVDEEEHLAGIVTQTDLIGELKREYESSEKGPESGR